MCNKCNNIVSWIWGFITDLLYTVQENPNLWEQVCRSLGLKAVKVIANQKDVLVQKFSTNYIPSQIDEQVMLL